MPACEHALTARVSPPSSSTAVYKEECTQCFDNYDMEAGIDVCLTCFNGGCTNERRQHAQQHALKTGHHLAVTIKRTKKPAPAPSTGSASEDGQRPAKLTKLEIKEDSDDQYEATSSVRCWACGGRHVDTQATAGLAATVLAVVHAAEARQAGEIKAWAEEVTGCEHFEGIEQQAHGGF
ncbi:ubiquitin C-terminal hydrolase Ubp14, partial [Linderina macrospora]